MLKIRKGQCPGWEQACRDLLVGQMWSQTGHPHKDIGKVARQHVK